MANIWWCEKKALPLPPDLSQTIKIHLDYGEVSRNIQQKEDVSDAEELTRDLMALLASFSSKYYGRRSLERRKHKN